MSQFGPDIGRLLQSGMLGGAEMYLRGQDMRLAQQRDARNAEEDAIRNQLLQQEFVQRRQQAEDNLASREADDHVLKTLFEYEPSANQMGMAVTGPRPGKPLGEVPGLPAGQQLPGIPGVPELPGASSRPGMGVMAAETRDWFDAVDPAKLRRASPWVQEMYIKARADRDAVRRDKLKATYEYNFFSDGSHGWKLKNAPLPYQRKWVQYGLVTNPEDLSPEVRDEFYGKGEAAKSDMLTVMRLAGDGAIDDETYARLSLAHPTMVADEYKLWRAGQQQREAHRQRIELEGVRQKGRVELAGMRPDQFADNRVSLSIEQAKSEMTQARDEYKALAGGKLIPPSANERTLAKTTDVDTGIFDFTGPDPAEVEQAKTKVEAWQRYQDAQARVSSAFTTGKAALSARPTAGASAPATEPVPAAGATGQPDDQSPASFADQWFKNAGPSPDDASIRSFMAEMVKRGSSKQDVIFMLRSRGIE